MPCSWTTEVAGGTRLLVEDSEVDCKMTGGNGFGEAHITVRRVNVQGCENGFDINQNFTVEDSYIHDLYNGGDAHTDGAQFARALGERRLV